VGSAISQFPRKIESRNERLSGLNSKSKSGDVESGKVMIGPWVDVVLVASSSDWLKKVVVLGYEGANVSVLGANIEFFMRIHSSSPMIP
jgi:hypothetical protein